MLYIGKKIVMPVENKVVAGIQEPEKEPMVENDAPYVDSNAVMKPQAKVAVCSTPSQVVAGPQSIKTDNKAIPKQTDLKKPDFVRLLTIAHFVIL